MRIALIDDMIKDRTHVRSLLDKFSKKQIIDIDVNEFTSAEDFLAVFEKGKYDLVLSDILMGGISGIEMGRKLRLIDENCIMVFLTVSNYYAQESYELNAFNYLLKPVEEDKFFKLLTNVSEKLEKNEEVLRVTTRGRFSVQFSIPFSKIIYIDIVNRAVCIHMIDKSIEIAETLSECKKQLELNDEFVNCCKGYIVNLNHVKRLEDTDFYMTNNVLVPIKKRYNQDIKNAYMKHKLKNFIED